MRRILALAFAFALSGCATFTFFSSPPPVFVVFFPDRDVTLAKNGQKIVDEAAAAARLHGGKMVELAGPSTKVAPGYDPSLAEPRIHAVETALEADGIAQSRLARTAETTDGINVKSDPSGAQRVEIRLVDSPAAP